MIWKIIWEIISNFFEAVFAMLYIVFTYIFCAFCIVLVYGAPVLAVILAYRVLIRII